jgi:hypothetical protein
MFGLIVVNYHPSPCMSLSRSVFYIQRYYAAVYCCGSRFT